VRKTTYVLGMWSREERVVLIAGALGLGVAAFWACGGDDDSTRPNAEDGGAEDSGSSSSTGPLRWAKATGLAEPRTRSIPRASRIRRQIEVPACRPFLPNKKRSSKLRSRRG
jgi:hypothetical protein